VSEAAGDHARPAIEQVAGRLKSTENSGLGRRPRFRLMVAFHSVTPRRELIPGARRMPLDESE
jgi:hypothetical protein